MKGEPPNSTSGQLLPSGTSCLTYEHLLECRNGHSKRPPNNTYFPEHIWSFLDFILFFFYFTFAVFHKGI